MNISLNDYGSPISQSQTVMDIERIVKDIEFRNQQGAQFNEVLHHNVLERLYCQPILESMPRFLSIYSHTYDYSEHVDAFFIGCKITGILVTRIEGGIESASMGNLTLDHVVALLAVIAEHVKLPQFKRIASDRLYQTKTKKENLETYAMQLHSMYSKLLVVRVDLRYSAEYKDSVSISEVYRHLESFIAIKDALSKHMVGHAWVLEQGGKYGGYHIHAVFYFLGSKHQNDAYMATQAGNLWHSVTGGRGCFFNCNLKKHKAKFERTGTLGVGMIHRNNPVEVKNAIAAISYLACLEKKDQYLRIKPKGRRTFATGQFYH